MNNTYRIFALNTATAENNEYTVWASESELDEQIQALNDHGYDSVTVVEIL